MNFQLKIFYEMPLYVMHVYGVICITQIPYILLLKCQTSNKSDIKQATNTAHFCIQSTRKCRKGRKRKRKRKCKKNSSENIKNVYTSNIDGMWVAAVKTKRICVLACVHFMLCYVHSTENRRTRINAASNNSHRTASNIHTLIPAIYM